MRFGVIARLLVRQELQFGHSTEFALDGQTGSFDISYEVRICNGITISACCSQRLPVRTGNSSPWIVSSDIDLAIGVGEIGNGDCDRVVEREVLHFCRFDAEAVISLRTQHLRSFP